MTCFLQSYFIKFIFGCAGSLLLRARLSVVAASGGYTLATLMRTCHCSNLCLMGLLALQHVESTLTRDRTLCPLHWQTDSEPLDDQGSPTVFFICMIPTVGNIALTIHISSESVIPQDRVPE